VADPIAIRMASPRVGLVHPVRLDVRDLTLLVVLGYLLVPQVKCSVAIMEGTWQAAAATLERVSAAGWHAIKEFNDARLERILRTYDQ
jgi:hypothetical protein